MNKLKALDILDSLQADIYATELYSMEEITDFLRYVQDFLETGTSVVRCRNCIYWNRKDGQPHHSCPHMGIKETSENFYCREGKKPDYSKQ